MKYAIIQNNTVVNVAVADAPLADNWIASEVAAIGDTYENGAFIKPPPPVKTPEELQAEIVEATQKRLDDFARTRNYDGILSACTYASSSVPKFAAEGQYCVDARDNTWATLYTILGEVQAGTRPVPTGFDDIAGDLPALEWPA
jgi:hypothetical protein